MPTISVSWDCVVGKTFFNTVFISHACRMHVHHLRFMGLRCGEHIFLRLTGCFSFCLAYAAADSVSGQRWVMNLEWVLT